MSDSPPQNLEQWFENIWARREDHLYRAFFGDLGPGIYNLSPKSFAGIGIQDPDPRFLTHGIFECPPGPLHPDWIYVTSGMSNPWGQSPDTADPAGYSGLGMEFTLHTRDRQQWPIQFLHWLMAIQLATAAGLIRPAPIESGPSSEDNLPGLLHCHDRIPIGPGIPTQSGAGLITHFLAASPDEPGLSGSPAQVLTYPAQFQLPSGHVDFLLMVGITTSETNFARTQGVPGLITLLRHHNIFPHTIPTRPALV